MPLKWRDREAVMRGSTPIPNAEHAFDPETNAAIATALKQVCDTLRINGDATAREVIAGRIMELARRGERNAAKLRDRVLMEAGGSGL
jgi:hypothetical protein